MLCGPALLPDFTSDLERAFVRFRTRVGEEYFGAVRQPIRRGRIGTRSESQPSLTLSNANEQLRELRRPGIIKHVRRMRELAGLFCHALYELGVSVPEGVDGHAGCEVEVLASLRVPDIAALTAGEDERWASVDTEEDVLGS